MTNINPHLFKIRQNILDSMKKLPPIAIRNLKSDIKQGNNRNSIRILYFDKLLYYSIRS